MRTETGTDIGRAAEFLLGGSVVAIPTETVYGLAANALDADAVLRIYVAKDRPRFNPLILHLPAAEAFDRYAASLPEACLLLAEAFCPGPLTFLLPKREIVPDLVTAGSDRVALRIPNHPMTLELLREIERPLAAPSANPSGYVSPVTAEHVAAGLGGRIPYILDGGPCRVGLESTIIGFEADGVRLYRHGAITAEQIRAVTGQPVFEADSTPIVQTPGRLKSHYAPHARMKVCDVRTELRRHGGAGTAVISFQDTRFDPEPQWVRALSPAGDLQEAARNLFQVMRELDAAGAALILAERFPDEGLGRAINDRLDRAQSIHRS